MPLNNNPHPSVPRAFRHIAKEQHLLGIEYFCNTVKVFLKFLSNKNLAFEW